MTVNKDMEDFLLGQLGAGAYNGYSALGDQVRRDAPGSRRGGDGLRVTAAEQAGQEQGDHERSPCAWGGNGSLAKAR